MFELACASVTVLAKMSVKAEVKGSCAHGKGSHKSMGLAVVGGAGQWSATCIVGRRTSSSRWMAVNIRVLVGVSSGDDLEVGGYGYT